MKKSTIKMLLMAMAAWAGITFAAQAQQMPRCDARFIFAPDSGAYAMQFMAMNNGPGATYAWDFGDGGTASNGYATHSYASGGVYYVCLTVTKSDSAGNQLCSSTHCDSVRVMNPPPPPPVVCDARFIHRQSFQSLNVNFLAAQNAPGSSYAWDYGDGSNGIGMNSSHVYANPGAYYVCLTVTTTDSSGTVLCTDTRCDSILVMGPPQPVCNARFFYFAPRDSAANVVVAGLRNRPNAQYSWDFGDGTTDTGRVAAHTYANAGTYYVCLTVTTYDSTGAQLCTDTWCDSVRTNRRRRGHRHHHNGHRMENTSTSIDGVSSAEAKAVMFPNPVTEKSTLLIESFSQPATVTIMDQSGRIISERSNITNGELSFSKDQFAPGLYYYSVNSGAESVKGKFIVQ